MSGNHKHRTGGGAALTQIRIKESSATEEKRRGKSSTKSWRETSVVKNPNQGRLCHIRKVITSKIQFIHCTSYRSLCYPLCYVSSRSQASSSSKSFIRFSFVAARSPSLGMPLKTNCLGLINSSRIASVTFALLSRNAAT